MTKPKPINLNPIHFQYAELSDASDKSFDGFAPGVDFVDQAGNVVTIEDDEVPVYFANTQKVIESTRGESGEVRGLPVDAKSHNKAEGAGNLIEAALEGKIIRFKPAWNSLGRQLIGDKVFNWFSATVDRANKVILGGSLTNWPATRKKNGQILLRPIELSSPDLIALQDGESLDDQSMAVRRAFSDSFQQPMDSPCCDEVFADYVVVSSGGKKFKVSYTTDEAGAVTFAPLAEWVEVVEQYVEASAPKQSEGVISMDITELELQTKIDGAVKAALAAVTPPAPAAPATPPTMIELSQLINLEGLSDEAKAVRMKGIEAAVSQMEQSVQLQYAQVFAKRQRDANIANLSAALVGGTPDAPRGVRGTTAADLAKRLAKLEPDDEKFFTDLLVNLQANGFVEYRELGHNRKLQGVVELEAPIADILKKFVADGHTVAEFFELNKPELGDKAQYNLSAYEPKEK